VSSTSTPDDAAAQAEALRTELADAEDEIHALRRRLQESPGRVQALEERLLESKGQLAHATSQNEKLTFTLQQAKEQLAALREEVEKLTQPPAAYGTFLGVNEDGTVDVFSSGRKMRVSLHPDIDPGIIRKGNEVVLGS
jgi:proteasome-associated ATPase